MENNYYGGSLKKKKKKEREGRNRALEWKAAPTRKLKSPPLDLSVRETWSLDPPLRLAANTVCCSTLRCVNVTECAQVFFKCSSMLPHGGKSKCHKNSSTEERLLLPPPPEASVVSREMNRLLLFAQSRHWTPRYA